MNIPASLALASVLGFSLGVVGGCTAVVHRDDDVETCANSSDCVALADKRFAAACIGATPDVDGVCVAEFKNQVRCAFSNYESDPSHPFIEFEKDHGGGPRYASGCEDNPGTIGCTGPCQPGLTININGVCDDGLGPVPAVRSDANLAGRDIQDQFCRSFFCDVNFRCNVDAATQVCSPCRPDRPFSEGGCGDLYMNGVRSCAYNDDVDGDDGPQCAAPNSTTQAPVFGMCP